MAYVDVLYLKSKDIYDEFYIMFEYKLQPGIFNTNQTRDIFLLKDKL